MAEAATGFPESSSRMTGGDIVLDGPAHLVTVSGHAVTLALQEFRLLELLMANADHVMSSSAIIAAVWGPGFSGDPSTLAVHVLRLRRKLDRDAEAGASRHLRTVRGIGYVFDTSPVPD